MTFVLAVEAPRDPWEGFLRLRGGEDSPAALLDAPPGAEPSLARWAFAAVDPTWTRTGGFELLDADAAAAPAADARVPWTGGTLALVAYDAARRLERLPVLAARDRDLPDVWAARFDRVVAWDRAAGRAYACAPDADGAADLARRLARPAPQLAHVRGPAPAPEQTPKEFESRVWEAKRHVRDGDVFQVNLSQRFSAPFDADPRALYARLRAVNPAPFAAYVDAGRFQLLSSSPERLVRLDGREASARPVAGTRPRGATAEEDASLAAELASDAKERAEHVMLVDLARNDLGKVARAGSVHVRSLAHVERYARVQHLVSDVRAELAPGRTPRDLVEAAFPGGTITGAPKVRAMEIVEALEPVRRGLYTGSLVRLGAAGLDASILIRSLVVADGRVDLQAGAGVVEDSVPEREHRECLAKARALLEAFA